MRILFLLLFLWGSGDQNVYGGEREGEETVTEDSLRRQSVPIPEEFTPYFTTFFETAPGLCQRILDRTAFNTHPTRMKLFEDLSYFLGFPLSDFHQRIVEDSLGKDHPRIFSAPLDWRGFSSRVITQLDNKNIFPELTEGTDFLSPQTLIRLNPVVFDYPLLWTFFHFDIMDEFLYEIFLDFKISLKNGCSESLRTSPDPLSLLPVGRYPIEEIEDVLLPCNVATFRGHIAADLIKIFLTYPEKEEALERIKPYLQSEDLRVMSDENQRWVQWYIKTDDRSASLWMSLKRGEKEKARDLYNHGPPPKWNWIIF